MEVPGDSNERRSDWHPQVRSRTDFARPCGGS